MCMPVFYALTFYPRNSTMTEDIALLVDVIFTFVVVFLGNIGMSDLSNIRIRTCYLKF